MKLKHYTKFIHLLLICLGVQAAPADDAFQQAREAVEKGSRAKLEQALEKLRGHELEPWAEYQLLRFQLEENTAGIVQYLTRHEGAYFAERLRSDWIKTLGRRGQWDELLHEYRALQQPDQEAQCYALQARLEKNDVNALEDARPIWLGAAELPESCRPVMNELVLAKKLDAIDVWDRVRRLLEAKKIKPALQVADYLPDTQIPDPRALDAITDNPVRWLARLSKSYIDAAKDSKRNRETLLYAVTRIAASSPEIAANELNKLDHVMSAADLSYAWGRIALNGAYRHAPQTLSWFARTEAATLNDEQLAWWARAALRVGDWNMIRRVIARMPPALSSQPDWVYWQGRALMAEGKQAEARAIWHKIAALPIYYGNLAAEELGQTVSPPPLASPITTHELGEAMANPGLRRALALIRADVRMDGVREWNWTLRGMSDRQLLAAAEFANRTDHFDRAINAAEKTVSQHDYTLRYLAPYREKVEPRAKELALDPAWVYGLMRQESRFVIQAKSSAGAQGLMQVMPSTAKWVAKKIGLSSYHPKQAMDMDTNITLGTNYMKMVLEGLDNHPVLASAAYNAGPGRAKKWRADTSLEGAVYVESIPFSETRDYVKKVMSNTMYYNALFNGKPQPLKSRLGIIRPQGTGDAGAEELP